MVFSSAGSQADIQDPPEFRPPMAPQLNSGALGIRRSLRYWAKGGCTRYSRLAGISLGVSILAAAPAAAQRVEEARVALAPRAAAAPAAPLRAWSEPRREIPLGPFVVAGAAVGAVVGVRSVMRYFKNNGDAAMMAPVYVLKYVGGGVAVGAVCGLTVGALVRHYLR